MSITQPKLALVGLKKEFRDGSVAAVDGVDLAVEAGETVALLGPSGCGKSTTLNMIAGIEEPTQGDILIDGRSIVGVPPGRRNIGLVFQDYAVFTHMSVRRNLSFGLDVRGVAKAEVARAVAEVADLLGMSDQLDVKASELGGSQLQRVAIGRTLVTKPAILLLDEPLSNLEAAARLAMRRELRRLAREIGLTIIYVTHDQIEALSLADRIAVMNAGKIRQVERTERICDEPGHVFVAGFLGSPPMNLVPGHLERRPMPVFAAGRFRMSLGGVAPDAAPDGPMTLGLRPERLRLTDAGAAPMMGDVVLVEPRGPEAVVTVEVAGIALKVVVSSDARPAEGFSVGLLPEDGAVVLFSGETGRRIAA